MCSNYLQVIKFCSNLIDLYNVIRLIEYGAIYKHYKHVLFSSPEHIGEL